MRRATALQGHVYKCSILNRIDTAPFLNIPLTIYLHFLNHKYTYCGRMLTL